MRQVRVAGQTKLKAVTIVVARWGHGDIPFLAGSGL